MLVAGVDEQLGLVRRRDELAGGVDVALAREVRVLVHAVDLHRHARRPGRPELRDGQARIEEQRPPGAGASLRQLLRRHHAERETGVDELVGELVRRPLSALDNLLDDGKVSPGGKFLIKLDVEGVEIEAIKGCARLLKEDSVILCEEHGNDPKHTVSRFILEQTPLKLIVYDPRSNRMETVTELSILDRIKVSSNVGYNVFGTASAFWQDRINALMIRAARRGRRVVRLKGGDPFVLGRGGEEAIALASAAVPFDVVPGVTSAIAAPALAGIPVTHRGLASSFFVVSGHDEESFAASIQHVEPGGVTLVVLMGLGARIDD